MATSPKLKKQKLLNTSQLTECYIKELTSDDDDIDNCKYKPEIIIDDLEVTSEGDKSSNENDYESGNSDDEEDDVGESECNNEEEEEEDETEEEGSNGSNSDSFVNGVVKISSNSEIVTVVGEPLREFQPFEAVDISDVSVEDGKCHYSKLRGCPGSLNTQRLVERHFPSLIPITGKKKKPVRRCVVCSVKKLRREVRYFCEDCGVALCVVPCFKIYHTKLYF